jgi:protein phosphatase
VLVVAEQAKLSDTGRQRRANEDAAFARKPLFAVADGMGGAQAGEIASGVAVSVLEHGLPDGPGSAEERLAALVQDANARIHELSVADAERAGMGTTMTSAYLGEDELAVAHVGDSRLYCLRGGELQRLTRDHSLVEELVQEGRLTPEEADEHPQRSIITRALGPELDVVVDHMSWRADDGDIYLICSDGLTSMVPEAHVRELIAGAPSLAAAARALVDAANEAGGRDNITVVLFRVEEVAVAPGDGGDHTTQHTMVGAAAPSADEVRAAAAAAPADAPATGPVARRLPRAPNVPATGPAAQRRGRRLARTRRALKPALIVALILAPIVIGAYFASQAVYFVGASRQGFVTLYQGVPYSLPFGIDLYSTNYTSGVTMQTLPPKVRHTVRDHELRSRRDAADLVAQIEQGKLAGQQP